MYIFTFWETWLVAPSFPSSFLTESLFVLGWPALHYGTLLIRGSWATTSSTWGRNIFKVSSSIFLVFRRNQILVSRASLVAQWLGVRLPMQGMRVWALVREDPTCHGALSPCATTTEPVLWSPRATTTEPALWSPQATTAEACVPGARAPQQGRPLQWEARTPQPGVSPTPHNWRKPVHSNKDPTQPKIKMK